VKDTSLFALKGIDFYHLFQHHPDQYAIVFLNIARDGSERSTKNIPLSHISLKHCRAKTRLTPGEIALRRHRIWDEHGDTSDIKKKRQLSRCEMDVSKMEVYGTPSGKALSA
jgi:hypothetical protein